MPAEKLEQFGGMLPAWDEHLLPKGQAAFARDGYLFSGALQGWRKPKLLRTLTNSAAKMAYRIPTTADETITGPSVWLEFDDANTHVMRSQVVNDSHERFYWASPSDVPRYNTKARIINGDPAWKLGVPAPGCAPDVIPSGGGNSTTLGWPDAGTGADVLVPVNTLFLVPIRPAGAMQIEDVSFIPVNTDASVRMTGVIYTSNSGTPYRLLEQANLVQGTVGGTAVVLPFNIPLGLLKDVQYWIGFVADTDVTITRSNDLNTSGYKIANTWADGPLVDAGGGTNNQITPELWADMTTSAVLEGRAYVYTWVTDYGEEGPPSNYTLETGWSNGSWDISLFQPVAADMGTDRNITKVRLYRTLPSLQGAAGYFLVTEQPIGTASWNDSATDDVIVLNSQLESTNWFEPPGDMEAIFALPNGISVGFRANEIWFSEAYRPHAWPPGYVLTTEFPIVGLGTSGQSVVACTTSMPYVATGVNPGSMSLNKVPLAEPCVAHGSILGRDDGVYYCSPNGLIRVAVDGSAQNTTEMWITRDKWTKYTPSKFHRAIQMASCYFCFGSTEGADVSQAQIGFNIEMNNDAGSFTIWPQPGGHRLGFMVMSAHTGFDIDNVLTDHWSGVGMLVSNGGVWYYDFLDQAPVSVPYKWRSKIFQEPNRKNFGAFRVYFGAADRASVPSGTRNVADANDASWLTLEPNQIAIVRVYADGNLITCREVTKSGELLRILATGKYEEWEFEIEGRVVISNLQFAPSIKELAQV